MLLYDSSHIFVKGESFFLFRKQRGGEVTVAGIGQQDHNVLALVLRTLCQLDGSPDGCIKYSAPGGRITVKLWKGQYKAFIEIIDQGRGIPPEDLENVKTKFYKGSNSVRGSGIGLALVDSIMTALDGTLDIKSTLGRGTVVTLGLPLYQK